MRATTSLAIALVLGLFVPPGRMEGAKAAPVTSPVLTPPDVKLLQEALAKLNESYERQGLVLKSINLRLDTLEGKVDSLPQPLTSAGALVPLQQSMGTVVRSLDAISQALERHYAVLVRLEAEQARLGREVQRNAEGLDKLMPQTASLHSQVRGVQDELQRARQERARPVLPPPAAAPPAPGPLAWSGWIAALAVLLAGTVWLGLLSRLRLATLRTSQEQLSAALARLAPPVAPAALPEEVPTAVGPHGPVLDRLQHLVERLEHQPPLTPAAMTEDSLPPAVNPPMEPVAAGHFPPGFWPAPFGDATRPLHAWCARLERDLNSPDHPSLPVLAALLRLRVAVESRPPADLPEVAASAAALSQGLYAYLTALPEATPESTAESGGEWLIGLKAWILQAAPRLDLRDILPGTRFSHDTMLTVREGPGNHLLVAGAYSWAVLDRSDERVRVLHRARVATN